LKHIDIREFVDEGYLQEVNRRFLHPLGLALEVVEEPDGSCRIGGVWDYRDDPEGVLFAPEALDADKALRVECLGRDREEPRKAALGYWVQPARR